MTQQTKRTPELSEILRNSLDSLSASIRVMMPAKVIEYDETTQLAKVQPLFQDTFPGKTAQNLPELFDVPVVWMRVGLAVIYLPLKAGDQVALLFSDMSLDLWQESDGQTPLDPQDTRRHNLTDAVAVPGLYAPTNPIPTVDGDDVRIILFDSDGNVRSQIYLSGSSGDVVVIAEDKVRLGAESASQQAILGNDFLTFFNSHIHNTGVGPSGPPQTSMTTALLSQKAYVQKSGDS